VWSSNFANRVKDGANHRISCMTGQALRCTHQALQLNESRSCVLFPSVLVALVIALLPCCARSQTAEAGKPVEWKSVSFAIVRFNDEAPASWNIYHTSKRGLLLLKLWKRYLLINVPEHQVFDIDPRTVKPQGDGVQWSSSDMPQEPLEITEWKDRNVGPVERLRFRLGKDGHLLELQIPLRADGKPAY
jgi:hypothetical protein